MPTYTSPSRNGTWPPLMGGDFNGPSLLVGGRGLNLPKQEDWSWTKPNTTVKKAISNLLYWKKDFEIYFARNTVVVNAYDSIETKMFSQRLTLEMVRNPMNGLSKKLVLTIIISRNSIGRPTYSASAYEALVFPVPIALFSGYTHLSPPRLQEILQSNEPSSLGIGATITALRTLGISGL